MWAFGALAISTRVGVSVSLSLALVHLGWQDSVTTLVPLADFSQYVIPSKLPSLCTSILVLLPIILFSPPITSHPSPSPPPSPPSPPQHHPSSSSLPPTSPNAPPSPPTPSPSSQSTQQCISTRPTPHHQHPSFSHKFK